MNTTADITEGSRWARKNGLDKGVEGVVTRLSASNGLYIKVDRRAQATFFYKSDFLALFELVTPRPVVSNPAPKFKVGDIIRYTGPMAFKGTPRTITRIGRRSPDQTGEDFYFFTNSNPNYGGDRVESVEDPKVYGAVLVTPATPASPLFKVGDIVTWGTRAYNYVIDGVDRRYGKYTAHRADLSASAAHTFLFGDIDNHNPLLKDAVAKKAARFTDADFYRPAPTPLVGKTPRIAVGQVYYGKPGGMSSFKTMRVLSYAYNGRWNCESTPWNSERKTYNQVRTSVLQSDGYSLTPPTAEADFNRNATPAYQRPATVQGRPVIDIPTHPTAPACEADAIVKFLKLDKATLIHVHGVHVQQAKSVKAKIALLSNAKGGVMLLLVPGNYSMDSFYVDSREDALKALGLVPLDTSTPTVATVDASGRKWVQS